MARYLGQDANTGAIETFEYDESNDTFAIGRRSLDLQPIIDHNKYLSNHESTWDRVKEARLVANIPIDVTYVWLQRYGVRAWDRNHWSAVRRLLNDSEWRYLKCQNVII